MKIIICSECGEKKPHGAKGKCTSCYMKEYNQRPEVTARNKARNQKPEVKAKQKAYLQRPDVKARKNRQSEYSNKRSKEARTKILLHYGNKCACCGETIPEFLSIDHVNNDGAKERKELKLAGYKLYNHIIRTNYPSNYQILCRNCNWGKMICGTCPHQH